jgi:hypothetical protein
LKPPPAKGIADSHCKKISTSLVQPLRCTRQASQRSGYSVSYPVIVE